MLLSVHVNLFTARAFGDFSTCVTFELYVVSLLALTSWDVGWSQPTKSICTPSGNSCCEGAEHVGNSSTMLIGNDEEISLVLQPVKVAL